MNKTYYKVVSKDLKSIWISKWISIKEKGRWSKRNEKSERTKLLIKKESQSLNQFNVKYSLNKWTFPKVKGSKLFVFDSLSASRRFANNHIGLVYECEVLNPKKTGPFYSPIISCSDQALVMWKKYAQKKKYMNLKHGFWNIPYCTVWVDAVKLIKKVDIR